MKSILAALFVGLTPILVLAQVPMTPPPDDSARPKPLEPVIPREHNGFGRIGVRLVFDKETGLPQIAALTRGGPAADFGFQVGDVILKIDKNYTNSLSPEEVRMALHGDPGTGVELTVQRGDNPLLIIRAIERRVLPANAEDLPDASVAEAKP